MYVCMHLFSYLFIYSFIHSFARYNTIKITQAIDGTYGNNPTITIT